MAKEIHIQVIESFTVKPSSPTPDKHRSYKLSFLDQFCPAKLTPLILFYPSFTRDLKNISETSQLLTKSLSQTLTRFYPFAGRLRGNVAIECNDEGAEFEATRVHCLMSEILDNPDLAKLAQLVPSRAVPREALLTSPLLLVQANFFDCGGMAIGVCLSHKAGDASTLSTFLTYWAATTAKSEVEPALIPQFVASTLIFPPLDSSAFSGEAYPEADANEKIRAKRLVFDGPRIDALRSKLATNSSVPNPTRVEAVSALIWKCLIEVVSNGSESDQLSSFFIQTANVRRRLDPPLPENSVGNLLWFFQAEITSGEAAIKTEAKDLVVLLREGMEGLKRICKAGIPPETLSSCFEALARWEKNAGIVPGFSASSWCRYPLYGVDFGWGKPVWVCSPYLLGAKNAILMMDTRDGRGIEVVLWLDEVVMECFEKHHELLAFASLEQM